MENELTLIGVASGIAAGDIGCGDGPLVLQKNNFLQQLQHHGIKANWLAMLEAAQKSSKLLSVAELCCRLATITCDLAERKHPFTVLGGDHSCAIGTWSGVYAAHYQHGPIGLIWVDAHMDSHTFATTPSGNIHGMPLAALLGNGEAELVNILQEGAKLQPENVALIGIRSFEPGEAELLKRLRVRIYDMDEIHSRGLEVVFQEAKKLVMKNTIGYGLTIDLDAVDPLDAPGVGSPEADGIRREELLNALKAVVFNDPKLLGLEIVEFNPHRDNNQQTERLISEIMLSCF